MIKRLIVFRNHEELERHDREYWRSKTPDDRIDMVEILRIEAGKMLNYE